MVITYEEIASLEQLLSKMGQQSDPPISQSKHAELQNWFDQTGSNSITPQRFAELVELARGSRDPRTQRIANGALVFARQEIESCPDKVRYVTNFALNRIKELLGEKPIWSIPNLTDQDRYDALSLFEAAKGDKTYTEEELINGTEEIIEKHRNSPLIFGRLAHDLKILVDEIRNEDTDPQNREIARAALTYLVYAADAIPDDLGLVGFLDDAMVVHEAISKVMPTRSALTQLLDTLISDYPFLAELRLESSKGDCTPSEFVLLNALMLLQGTRLDAEHANYAIIVTDTEPLPFFLAFILGICEVWNLQSDSEIPKFDYHQRLVHRGSKAEAIFLHYCRKEDQNYVPCNRTEATHFKVEARGKGRGKCLLTRTWDIKEIFCYRRSNRQSDTLKKGKLIPGRDKLDIGPIERLFSRTRPLILPGERKQIVVVGPIKSNEFLASEICLHKKPLHQVLPMGRAIVSLEGEIQHKTWSTGGVGGEPLLSFVSNVSEAAEIVELNPEKVLAVISSVKPNSLDSVNLCLISQYQVPVFAFCLTSDSETHKHLEQKDFVFWDWNDEWLNHIHWPTPDGDSENPLKTYERRVLSKSKSKTSVDLIPSEELSDVFDTIEQLRDISKQDPDDGTEVFFSDLFNLTLKFCRQIVPATEETYQAWKNDLIDIRKLVKDQKRWWPEPAHVHLDEIGDKLQLALESCRNPILKCNRLLEILANNQNSVILGNRFLEKQLASFAKTKFTNFKTKISLKEEISCAIVPAWFGKGYMPRFIDPPAANDVHLILYPPEKKWYDQSINRKKQELAILRSFHEKRPAIPLSHLPTAPLTLLDSADLPNQSDTDPDEILIRARRNRAISQLEGHEGEPVQAKLVHFQDGYWAAFTENHRVYVLTITEQESDGDIQGHIDPKVTSELRLGDIVMIRKGSPSDLIREIVDSRTPLGTRSAANVWRSAIQRNIKSGNSLHKLVEQLTEAGCKRAIETVDGWIKNDRIISPTKGETDIAAILEATQDQELKQRFQECTNAIELLRSEHLKVGFELAGKAVESAKQWLEAGATPLELIDLENRLVLVTIEAIDDQELIIGRGACNRLEKLT